MAVNPNQNDLLLVISLMNFLNNGMPFIHKTNLRVYIKHFIEKKLWAYLPNPNMECNVLKIITTKYFLLKPAGTQKLDITHSNTYNNWYNKIIISSSIPFVILLNIHF